jgi:hypothetical protein
VLAIDLDFEECEQEWVLVIDDLTWNRDFIE